MKRNNPIDSYIEELSLSFSKIPNFDILQEKSIAKDIFDSLSNKMIEVAALRSLYQDYYCPAAIKCIEEQRKLIAKSKYVSLSDEVNEDLQDIYYSTIRNGYVHLFHLIESYKKILFEKVNEACTQDGKLSIEEYFSKQYEFNIDKHWRRTNNIVEKINWICNRVKHWDGFPNNDISRLPLHYLMLAIDFRFDEEKRIRIEIEEFTTNINEVLQFFTTFSTIIAKIYVLQLCEGVVISLKNKKGINVEADKNINLFIESYQGLKDNISELIRLWRVIGIEDK